MSPYYEEDGITIYHGDVLEVLNGLPDGVADAVVADPPYSSGTRQATNRTASSIPKRGERWAQAGINWDSSYSSFGVSQLLNWTLRVLRAKTKPGSHVYLFTDWRTYPVLNLSVEWAGMFSNNLIVWDKGVYALGTNWRSQHELIVFASNGPAREVTRHDQGNVIKTSRISGGQHPTQKPVDLIHRLLDVAGGVTVLDPFMGTGSTLAAAQILGRPAIGIEIEERYCEIAAQRLAQGVLNFNDSVDEKVKTSPK